MTDELIVHISTRLWHDYSEADKVLTTVRSETNDGSKDWEDFHAMRLLAASTAKEQAWKYVKEFNDIYKDVVLRAMGL